MDASSSRWTTVSDSPHDHEREALAFLRRRLPDREPYRVWSNFEFTTANGKLYEVDALAITDNGVHLIEIKSHPGQIGGDGATWQWTTPEGKRPHLRQPPHAGQQQGEGAQELLERRRPGGVAAAGEDRGPALPAVPLRSQSRRRHVRQFAPCQRVKWTDMH
ncbi:MAG: NERD domain-containing protein [Acidimicrobiales bacterium]